MQKAEPQKANVQSQPAARQGGALALASSQGEQIAQRESMTEFSPQVIQQGGMAEKMGTSASQSVQRKLATMIHNSQRQAVQRKLIDGIHNSPHVLAQMKSIEGIQSNAESQAQRGMFDGQAGAAQRMGEEEPLQGKFDTVQRVEEEELPQGTLDTVPLQGKFTSEAPAQLEQQTAARPNNTGLPDNLKSGIENLSGMSMDHVKVHYNSSQPAQLNALAYAQGSDIHVAPGQEKHLPHEAWHVVQQAQGRVKPTVQMKGDVPVNDDVVLETEADVMGAKALASGSNVTQKINNSGQVASFHSISYQLRPDVYSTVHYANPEAYLAAQYPGVELNEDAGSGGILDKPVQRLVLALAVDSSRERYVARLNELGDAGILLATSLRDNVYDRTSAKTWVVENTLGITNVAPSFLTIENVMVNDNLDQDGNPVDPVGPAHTFHRDHGKVVLTDQELTAANVNSAPERGARRALANGPFNTGWVRGHYGVMNMRHRFIEHIHVDKDGPEDERFDIYNAPSAATGVTAAGFNIGNRAGLTEANDGRAAAAATAAEGDAKRVAWEQYEATLPAEE